MLSPFSAAAASSLPHPPSQPDSGTAVPPSLHGAIRPFPQPAMVGNVDRFEAVSSNFNQVQGNQENHSIKVSSAFSVLRRSPLTSSSTPVPPQPATSSRPEHRPRPRRISELSHYHAWLRMFGSISHFCASHSSSRSSRCGIAEALFLQAGVYSSLLTESTPSCTVLLSQAAELAGTIRNAAHRPRSDPAFIRLADHCCTLVSAIMIFQEQEGRAISPQLITSLVHLVKHLRPIANFLTTRRGFRETVKHVINKEATQFTEYRNKLMRALAEFGDTNFSLESGVAQIDMSQDGLVAALKKMASRAVPQDDPPSLAPTLPALITTPASDAPIPSGSVGATGSVRNDVQRNQINVSHSQNISMSGGTIFFGSLGPDTFTPPFPPGHSSPLLIPPQAVVRPSPGKSLLDPIIPDRSSSSQRQHSRQVRAETLIVPSTSSHHAPLVECTDERSDSPTQLLPDLPDVFDVSPKPPRPHRRRKKTVCRFYGTPGGCRNGSACNFRHGSMASPISPSSSLPPPLDDPVIHDSKD